MGELDRSACPSTPHAVSRATLSDRSCVSTLRCLSRHSPRHPRGDTTVETQSRHPAFWPALLAARSRIPSCGRTQFRARLCKGLTLTQGGAHRVFSESVACASGSVRFVANRSVSARHAHTHNACETTCPYRISTRRRSSARTRSQAISRACRARLKSMARLVPLRSVGRTRPGTVRVLARALSSNWTRCRSCDPRSAPSCASTAGLLSS